MPFGVKKLGLTWDILPLLLPCGRSVYLRGGLEEQKFKILKCKILSCILLKKKLLSTDNSSTHNDFLVSISSNFSSLNGDELKGICQIFNATMNQFQCSRLIR